MPREFSGEAAAPAEGKLPQVQVVDPLTDTEQSELDRIAADLLLPDLTPRERALVRHAVRFTLKRCRKPAPPLSAAPAPPREEGTC